MREFDLDLGQLHNDSTTVTFSGGYHGATGTVRGGKATPVITYGHNKDHRPDLKQLLCVLTICADGAVPIAFRVEDGNTADDVTHIPTWDELRRRWSGGPTSCTSPIASSPTGRRWTTSPTTAAGS